MLNKINDTIDIFNNSCFNILCDKPYLFYKKILTTFPLQLYFTNEIMYCILNRKIYI